jgi:putative transcriptional regulator
MDSIHFKEVRSRLAKTQKELAQLLGISIKAIHSYEQGWRKIPHHVERQLLFLVSRVINGNKPNDKCWDIMKCPEATQAKCPAREFKSGDLCWFINGTKCSGEAHNSWENKMEECRTCSVFIKFFENEKGIVTNG